MEIVPQYEWEGLAEELIKNKGIALLLGATDSGKSSLARYLIERLLSKGIRVSLVDSDIGQSTLGLPGTISMKTFTPLEFSVFLTGFKTQLDIKDFKYEKMSFIGVLNPAKQISSMIEETKRLTVFARKHSEIVLIDTTGLVSGNVGKALKVGKVKAIKPEHIIAVQWYNELEQILALIEIGSEKWEVRSDDIKIHRIKASRMAKIRSRESRIRYRKEKFDNYFNDPRTTEFLLEDVDFFYNGKPFSYRYADFKACPEPRFRKGTLIGLNHNEDTKALGILSELISNFGTNRFRSVTFKSPINSLKGINRVVLGDIVIE
jgi:polynucleotide 5'-hydroxyl-kinase GRC3/NOL9